MGLLYIEFGYLSRGCIIKGTKLLLAYKEYTLEFIFESSRSELRYKILLSASIAKLVRRHTSNVEIIGSNPIGSMT